jgi:hypothetical protein
MSKRSSSGGEEDGTFKCVGGVFGGGRLFGSTFSTVSTPFASAANVSASSPNKTVPLFRFGAQTSEIPETLIANSQKQVTQHGGITKRSRGAIYEIEYTRSSTVVEWDDETFRDCGGDERKIFELKQDHIDAAQKYDFDRASIDEIDLELLPSFLQNEIAWKEAGHASPLGQFSSLQSANAAAVEMAELALAHAKMGDGCALFHWSAKLDRSQVKRPAVFTEAEDGRLGVRIKTLLVVDVDRCDVFNFVSSCMALQIVQM